MNKINRFYPHTFPNGSHHGYGVDTKIYVYDETPVCGSTQGCFKGYEPIDDSISRLKVKTKAVWQPNKFIKDLMLSDKFLREYIRLNYRRADNTTLLEVFYGLTFARRVALDNPELYKEIHDMHFTTDGWNMFMAWRFRTKVIDAQPNRYDKSKEEACGRFI